MVDLQKTSRIELRKKVKSLKINSYIFFGAFTPISILLSPLIFSTLFPDARQGQEPHGYLFFPVLMLAAILPVRFLVMIGHSYYQLTNKEKFDRLDKDVAYYEHQSKKTWLNYFLFPIAFLYGFIYGNIVAITTTGITFFEGGWKAGFLALSCMVLIYILVQLEIITLWIFDILMLLFSEITVGEPDGYIPPNDSNTELLIDHYDSDGWEKKDTKNEKPQ